jgi:hypothetical protein
MNTRKTAVYALAIPEHRNHHFTIRSPHFSQAPLSLTLDHLDHIAAAHARDAFEDLVDLIIERTVVPLSPFTHVEVLDDALTAVRVRVLDGEDRGHVGWVPTTWLHTALSAAEADHPTTGRAA